MWFCTQKWRSSYTAYLQTKKIELPIHNQMTKKRKRKKRDLCMGGRYRDAQKSANLEMPYNLQMMNNLYFVDKKGYSQWKTNL